ncbi:MAG TPA: DUF2000 domain-containing protein [Mycobacteriales bacterium]|jgi:hypothetical protein|nr:DUF2000 domain-containing protein [Mycobacteriales bacterium]
MTNAELKQDSSAEPFERISTKLAIVVRDDLPTWQKLNVTAFMASGIAASQPGIIGESYSDASGTKYLPIFRCPVLVFAGNASQLRRAFDRAVQRGIQSAIFTADMFATGNDVDNRRVVRAVEFDKLDVVGFGFVAERKATDKVLKGVHLHG